MREKEVSTLSMSFFLMRQVLMFVYLLTFNFDPFPQRELSDDFA